MEFDDDRDADDAAHELNGKELCGERVVIEYARGVSRRDGNGFGSRRGGGGGGSFDGYRSGGGGDRGGGGRGSNRYGPPVRTEFRLIVENLSSGVSWQDLKDSMRQVGEVTYADAHKQKKNEGIVEFATHSDMKNAIDKLDDTEMNGRRIRLVEERPRSRKRSRSRSHSRGRRSRSRSRSRRNSPSRSRSRSRGRDHSRSKSNSRSPSPRRSKTRSRSRSPRSRSHSPPVNHDKSDREHD